MDGKFWGMYEMAGGEYEMKRKCPALNGQLSEFLTHQLVTIHLWF